MLITDVIVVDYNVKRNLVSLILKKGRGDLRETLQIYLRSFMRRTR